MGSPSKTSTMNATVRIDVYRNLRSPVFTGEPYVTNIQENTTTGTTVLSIQYRDDDSDVSKTGKSFDVFLTLTTI